MPVNLTSADFFANPEQTYRSLRRNHPVAPVEGGGFILTRYEDVVAAFSDARLGNAPSRFSVLAPKSRAPNTAASLASNIPPFLDKPDHIPARQAVSAAFFESFRTVPDWIHELAAQVLAASRSGQADLVSEIARPFVCSVMARFVGVPNDPSAIKQATDGFFQLFAPITDRAVFEHVNRQLQDAQAFIRSAMADGPPVASLLGALANSGLSTEQCIDNALLVLADGVENIEAAMALSFDLLQRNKARIPEGTAIDLVIEECLRLETPGQLIPRVARQDLEIKGTSISQGMPVFLALGSANLDPEAFDEPAEFRISRNENTALTFGKGRHSCIGAPLARLQIAAMLEALGNAGARRSDSKPLEFSRRFGHRWPVSMPIQFA